MKVAYLHGLESNSDPSSPKIVWLNEVFDNVYAPNINYRDPKNYQKQYNAIKAQKPDVIVGSSMGGYFAYLIGGQLGIDTVLFNPAVVNRSYEPEVNVGKMKPTSHNVFLGKNDKTVPGNLIKKFFKEPGNLVGNIKYHNYDGGHRVPEEVFVEAIGKSVGALESTSKRLLLFDEYISKLTR